MQSVLDNYSVLQELWEELKDLASDPSVKARIIGVQAQFKNFRCFFGVLLEELILKHSDNLSKTLQSPKLSASEGQRIATMTVKTLQSLRTDSNFDLFWRKAEIARQKLDVNDPELPRKRKLPKSLKMEVLNQNFLLIVNNIFVNNILKPLISLLILSMQGLTN